MTRTAYLTLALFLISPAATLANGGRLRVAEAPMGDYRVSVFTSPTPVPPDTLDVSILVMAVGRSDPVEGVEVQVTLTPVGHDASSQAKRATREDADDPRYYAAKFSLGGAGRWGVAVRVAGPVGEGEVDFQIEASERGILGSPVAVLFVSLLPLAVLAWWFLRSSEPSVTQRPDPEEE